MPVRLATEDAEALTTLADAWRCSKTAAVRRAIQEAVRRARQAGKRTAKTEPAE
jgi:hypothetical protein